MLKQESKVIQPHEESVEMVKLGTKEEVKEVKIGATMQDDVKMKLVKLLQEYMDVFAWSYQDMIGLDTDIMVNCLPFEEDYTHVNQKLRRTRTDMAMKIIEEVQKHLEAGFLAVAKYP